MDLKIVAPARGWKTIISALCTITDEAEFKLFDDGISFKILGADKAQFLSFTWTKQTLKEFSYSGIERIGFYTLDFDKILKRFDKDDLITMTIADSKYLRISSDTKSFDLRLVQIALNDMNEPKVDAATVAFRIAVDKLKSIVADITIFSDDVVFDGSLGVFRGSGESGNTVIKSEELVGHTGSSTYLIKHLQSILSEMTGLVEFINIKTGHNWPLVMDMEIPDVGNLRYIIAPKVL